MASTEWYGCEKNQGEWLLLTFERIVDQGDKLVSGDKFSCFLLF